MVFLDGDYSDFPSQMHRLVAPIVAGRAELVIGSRVLGRHQPGSLTPQARFGNYLACALIRLFWRVRYTDLGPFRAIRYTALRRLAMNDRSYGWTVQMQVNAARQHLTVTEAPVSYRKRIGQSKISGTLTGVLAAGTKILSTIILAAIHSGRHPRQQGAARQLVVFTRHPSPGQVKTRLIPALGPDGAAELHRAMTAHTLTWARQLATGRHVKLEVRFEGGSKRSMRQIFGHDLTYSRQCSGHLGQRMAATFDEAFDTGMEQMVLVGTDCPDLTAHAAGAAFDALCRHDLVLGPARDGGYYLIGLRRPAGRLFADMPWGTDQVLTRTLDAANQEGLSVALLEPLDDVDRPENLPVWQRIAGPGQPLSHQQRISVIIPTLNEVHHIAAAVASAQTAGHVEVIVVDGGSADGTAQLARSVGATVLTCPTGRAKQMNLGAAAAAGELLVFLHADTRLPAGFERHVRRTLARPGTAAGAFELAVDAPGTALRLIERLANWRSRRMQMPYGDQVLFIRAETFRRVGGYPDMPIMEDFELVRRLRSQGRIVIAPAAALTSARRWRQLGLWRTTLINQLTILSHWLGLSPAHLRRWRDRSRHRRQPGRHPPDFA